MSFDRLNRTNSLKKIAQSYTGVKPTITSATGGTVSTPGNGFTVHTYNGSDTFTITGLSGNITNVDYTSTYRKVGGTFSAPGSALQYVLVGGGGAGGENAGAGGGAGGFRTNQPGHPRATSDTTSSLSMGVDYTIQVGAGGPQSAANGQASGILQPSNPNFTSLQTTGGGGGCNSNDPTRPGGSGGGGASGVTGGDGNAGNYTPSEGQPGGTSNSGGSQNRSGGGGGGASNSGATTGSNSAGGPGGNGISITFDGTSRTFCGGGGGSSHYGGSQPTGGPGGGGNGGYGLWLSGNENNASNATAGGVNTGGGGGAGPGGGGIGKSGGSGKIMLRY